MRILRFLLIIILLSFVQFYAHSQTLPVGTPVLEDYYRRSQLLGTADSTVSLTVRPVFPGFIDKNANAFFPDGIGSQPDLTAFKSSWDFNKGQIRIKLLPASVQAQVNTDHPYGWNDGAMIPAKGAQALWSFGVFAQYGPLTIQLKPELVVAGNTAFDTFNTKSYDVIIARYYDIYNNVDLPVRFGTDSYNKLLWGQSSIRLNYKSLSFGISTENLWWGPGINNSLLMSNTSEGFLHLTLNTLRPLQTPIGSFEGQIIGGKLTNSGYSPLQEAHSLFGVDVNVPKPNDWRYLAGIVVTWQPKWVPGLFLGFDQASQLYAKDLNGIRDYLPLFSPVRKISAADGPIYQKDQINSIFMRWLWTQEHAEVYFEWGHYNYTGDLLQSLLSPDDSRAYVVGLRKIIPFNTARNESIMIGVEATQLQENSTAKIENGTEWYVSRGIRQGYTNNGQELGAGIGPGGNLQSVNVSWIKGLKKLGVSVERYAHNEDLYGYTYQETSDFRRHWVDLSVGLNGEWDYKNLIFNCKFQAIKSFNYQWYLPPDNIKPGQSYFVNGQNAFNLQILTGVTYRF